MKYYIDTKQGYKNILWF